jgi:Protein of unknown function (DUF664)
MPQRVPFTGEEKESLKVALDRHRDAILWKLEGLGDADLRVEPEETTGDILAFYGRARVAADRVIGEVGLEETGTAWFGDAVSMRWVLIHMVEETARHAGHVDIIRELLDGMVGDHRPD